MKCSCGERLSRNWKYCPECGSKVEKKNKFFINFNLFDDIKRTVESMFSNKPQNKGFTIKIRTGGPEFNIGRTSKAEAISSKPKKLPKNIEEPKANVRVLGDKVEVAVELPDVKSLDDINLVRVGDSLEIRAVAGRKKGYFKLLNIPSEYSLANKQLNDGLLAVRLTRRE